MNEPFPVVVKRLRNALLAHAKSTAVATVRRFLEQRRAAARVDVVPSAPIARGAAQVCTVCHANHLARRVGSTPAYSDVAAKRRVRAAFVRFVRLGLGLGRQEAPLLLVVDAWLPFAEDETEPRGSYLSEDLLAAGISGLTPERILSPNVDAAVVEDLRARCGLVHAAHECCCLFLARRVHTIRTLSGGAGFTACMLDVWGGFAEGHGARRPLEWLAQQRLLDARGAGVLFCASDRHARVAAGNIVQAREKARLVLHRDVLGANGYRPASFPACGEELPARYGQTMQTYACTVYGRKRQRA